MRCYRVRMKRVNSAFGNGSRHATNGCIPRRTAGLTTVHCLNLSTASRRKDQQGFSLAETLVAMLLLAMTISTLMQYHRALALGFSQQWQQRQAWQVAGQALLGREVAGWQIDRQQQSVGIGCVLERITVTGSQQRSASLAQLNCH
jgi:prepilin peptidase dependent protein C